MKLAIGILSLALVVLMAGIAFAAITWRERAFMWVIARPKVAWLLYGALFGTVVTMIILASFYDPPRCG